MAARSHNFKLSSLADVALNNADSGNVLGYDAASQTWRNQAPASGTTTVGRVYASSFGNLGTADDTAVIQAAINSLATTNTGMFLQNNSGVRQAGGPALGGGTVILPAGLFIVSTLVLGHRVTLDLSSGTVLRQKAGTSGPIIENRRDGTVHAKYCKVSGGTIDGNKANQSVANNGIHFTGDTTSNYTSPLDEDYDENHVIDNVHITRCKGSGLRLEGSGENRIINVKSDWNDAYGAHSDQDNFWSVCTFSWNGLAGYYSDDSRGDDNRLAVVKCWYNGQINNAMPGFLIKSDSGAMAGCSAQDNKGPGLLLDGAYGWNISGFMSDSNSMDQTGVYPGIDVYNSGYNYIGATCRNRYRGNASAGPQSAAVRHRTNGGGNVGNVLEIIQAAGVWGTSIGLTNDSTTTGSVVRVNGVVVP